MKKFLVILFLFLLPCFSWTQEEEDSSLIINDEFNDVIDTEEPENTIIESMGRSRVTLHAAYNFLGGFSPGWDELPWYPDESKFSYILGARMEALLSLDFQLSRNLKVWNSFYFSIPPESNNIFTLKEFYFDFDYNNIVFLRAGQYEVAWGISPFYPFTNLPSRIPEAISFGDSYIVKLDVPIGVGGLQILGMTRYGFMEDPSSPQFNEIAIGAKYNLALQSADIDMGFFYFRQMPLRFFTSIKTTFGKTEAYFEGLAAATSDTWDEYYYSGNIGMVRDFFDGIVTVAAEIFYNGEPDAFWYRPKEDIRQAESNPLFKGWNSALSFIVRPGILGMRIFSRIFYSYDIKTAEIVPGINIKLANQLSITLSVPMAIGSRDKDSYYRHNEDFNNRPLSIILGISLSGNFRYRIYMDKSAE